MQKTKKYEEHLMQALDFDESDLKANQSGRFTRRQMNRLNFDRVMLTLLWVIPALLGVGALSIWLLVMLSVENMPTDMMILVLLGGAAFVGWLGFYYGVKSQRLNTDLRENHVAETEGRVDLSLSASRNSVSYALRVDNESFSIKQQIFLAFKNGDPYCIYYAPHSKRILSVEWLRDDDNLLR